MPTSRRHFLQAATASSALAAQVQPRSANDRLQVACIGYGIMGQGDVQTAVSAPGVALVAVADVYQGRLTRARETHGPHVFTAAITGKCWRARRSTP